MSESRYPFLRLVGPDAGALAAAESTKEWQSNLFARHDRSLIVLLDINHVSEADLSTVLTTAALRYVIDLRIAPRFDVGRFNRKLVFSIFEKQNIRYFDTAGRLKVSEARDARLNPQILSTYLLKELSGGLPLEGPIALLVDSIQLLGDYAYQVVGALPSPDARGWEIMRLPHTLRKEAASRDTIFISHANPEDNDFTLWLGARLANSGFSVWSDATKLIGGEEFWDDIEDAIRIQASKVIVVLSKTAQGKKNVLDEINCAVQVERSKNLSGFVIPVRIDDLPFDQVRANLARKNIVDFSSNWAAGFDQLLKVLDRDRVPRPNLGNGAQTAAWYQHKLQKETLLRRDRQEELVSNWFPIVTLPDAVVLLDSNLLPEQFEKLLPSIKKPFFRYHRLIGTFADGGTVQADMPPQVRISETYRTSLREYLDGHAQATPGVSRGDANRSVINLLRQTWDEGAKLRGLLPYETASGSIAWFLPKGHIENDTVTFPDADGKIRRKLLVGRSEKRQVYWHFAVHAKPILGLYPRYVARSHVVFTLDGRTPIDNKDKMHALRRGFCKSWWNDRWRDLVLAYFHWFAGGLDEISFDTGTSMPISVGAKPLSLSSPVSLVDHVDVLDPLDEVLDDINWLDFDPDQDFDEKELIAENDDEGPAV